MTRTGDNLRRIINGIVQEFEDDPFTVEDVYSIFVRRYGLKQYRITKRRISGILTRMPDVEKTGEKWNGRYMMKIWRLRNEE